MNKELAIQKINRMGHAGQIIVNILKVFAFIGVIGCIALAGVFTVIPKDIVNIKIAGTADVQISKKLFKIIEPDGSDFWVDGKKVDLDGADGVQFQEDENSIDFVCSTDEYTINNGYIRSVIIMEAVTITCVLITLFFIGALCKAFRYCKTPFEDRVIRKMEMLAYIMLPWAFVSMTENFIISRILKGNCNAGYSLNIEMILACLVILALTYVFKYGAMLQKESDETL